MTVTTSEMACAILHATNDGDNLAPLHLGLVELAVNNSLNAAGEDAFKELYDSVIVGTYSPPWFHGIEHLTIDHIGYVLWKGQIVEHYTPGWAYTAEAKDAATTLADRCKHLESIDIPCTTTTAVWNWEKFEGVTPTQRKEA